LPTEFIRVRRAQASSFKSVTVSTGTGRMASSTARLLRVPGDAVRQGWPRRPIEPTCAKRCPRPRGWRAKSGILDAKTDFRAQNEAE